jgi:hypothetical protein
LADTTMLGEQLASWGTDARNTIDSWANTTFAGANDLVGNNILYVIQGVLLVSESHFVLGDTLKVELSSIPGFSPAQLRSSLSIRSR